jgi:hypothetical protein
MLKIVDRWHFNKVMGQAAEKELAHELLDRLQYLHNYGGLNEDGRSEWEVELGRDFAQLSFSVVWKKNGEFMMNGGLIFHGTSQEGNHWSVHT